MTSSRPRAWQGQLCATVPHGSRFVRHPPTFIPYRPLRAPRPPQITRKQPVPPGADLERPASVVLPGQRVLYMRIQITTMLPPLSFPLVLLCAVSYGATMKTADLLDEHGYKWFEGSTTLFGMAWGISGALLMLSDIYLASALLAMVVGFILRMRIDYRNHAIAAGIMLTAFVVCCRLERTTFVGFLLNFAGFGSVKDALGEDRQKTGWMCRVFESGWYYVVPTLICSIYTTEWLVFYVFLLYIGSYDAVKYWKEDSRGAFRDGVQGVLSDRRPRYGATSG